jgi:hypothetical protein
LSFHLFYFLFLLDLVFEDVLVLGPLQGLLCRSMSNAACDQPQATYSDYKEIHGWELPLLNLVEHGSEQAVNQGWLPPVLGLRQVSKNPKAPQDFPLSAGCLLGSATEKALGIMRIT